MNWLQTRGSKIKPDAGRARPRLGWQRIAGAPPAIGCAVLLLVLVACGSPDLAPTPTPGPATVAGATRTAVTPAKTPVGAAGLPCSTGELTVGDLPRIDAGWQAGVAEAEERALAWQSDAMLTTFRVSCQLFEPGFRWQAVYYSRNAQAFYSSDTGEVEPAGVDPESVPELDTAIISFGLVHRALVKSGIDDATVISPSTGVDVRMNTEASPFGPPAAPKGTILYHLAVDRLGETRDLFIEGTDGTVFRYTD